MKATATIFTILFLSFSAFSQNFGINQANPTEKLDVNGNIKADGTIESTSGGYKFPDGSTQSTASSFVIKKGQYLLASGLAYHQQTPTLNYTIPVSLPANTKAIFIAVYYRHTGQATHGYLNFNAYQQGATDSQDKTTFFNQHYNDYYNTDYYEQLVPWNASGSGNVVTIQVTNSYYTGGGTYSIYYTGYIAAD